MVGEARGADYIGKAPSRDDDMNVNDTGEGFASAIDEGEELSG